MVSLNSLVLEKEVRRIEQAITDLALAGTGLVINDVDLPEFYLLKQQLEELSGGLNRVFLDALGRPTIMVWFPNDYRARLSWLSNAGAIFEVPAADTLHPAFIVNGKPIKGFYSGKYGMVRVGSTNYPCSLYGLEPAHTLTFDQSLTLALSAAGATAGNSASRVNKIHVETAAELGYIMTLSARLAFVCRGNNSYGRAYNATSEVASPASIGSDGKTNRTLTGTGPVSWRHDGTIFGKEWGSGGVWQRPAGLRTYGGEIQYITNNNAADPTIDMSATSLLWKGITEAGAYADAGATGNLCFDFLSAPENNNQRMYINNQVEYPSSYYGSFGRTSLTAKEGVTLPAFLRYMLMSPFLSNNMNGYWYPSNQANSERVPLLVGDWSDASGWGAYMNGHNGRGASNVDIGSCPASYEE